MEEKVRLEIVIIGGKIDRTLYAAGCLDTGRPCKVSVLGHMMKL